MQLTSTLKKVFTLEQWISRTSEGIDLLCHLLYFTFLADIDAKRSKISTKSCPLLQRIYWIPVCKIKFIYSKEGMIIKHGEPARAVPAILLKPSLSLPSIISNVNVI